MKSTPTRGVKETLKPNAYNQWERARRRRAFLFSPHTPGGRILRPWLRDSRRGLHSQAGLGLKRPRQDDPSRFASSCSGRGQRAKARRGPCREAKGIGDARPAYEGIQNSSPAVSP